MSEQPKLLSVDFHSHTMASNDSLTSPVDLIAISHRRGLDRVIVTDHNTIAGALAAHAMDPEFVIVGEEIMTTQGEILASFVIKEIPSGLSPREVIARLRDQGAFISVSHPFDSWRSGAWQLEDLMAVTPLVDAVEIFNARVMAPGSNARALEYALAQGLPGTAGSDAHAAFELGRARLLLPEFDGPDSLRAVIRHGKVQGRQSPFWVHLFSRYANHRKKVV